MNYYIINNYYNIDIIMNINIVKCLSNIVGYPSSINLHQSVVKNVIRIVCKKPDKITHQKYIINNANQIKSHLKMLFNEFETPINILWYPFVVCERKNKNIMFTLKFVNILMLFLHSKQYFTKYNGRLSIILQYNISDLNNYSNYYSIYKIKSYISYVVTNENYDEILKLFTFNDNEINNCNVRYYFIDQINTYMSDYINKNNQLKFSNLFVTFGNKFLCYKQHIINNNNIPPYYLLPTITSKEFKYYGDNELTIKNKYYDNQINVNFIVSNLYDYRMIYNSLKNIKFNTNEQHKIISNLTVYIPVYTNINNYGQNITNIDKINILTDNYGYTTYFTPPLKQQILRYYKCSIKLREFNDNQPIQQLPIPQIHKKLWCYYNDDVPIGKLYKFVNFKSYHTSFGLIFDNTKINNITNKHMIKLVNLLLNNNISYELILIMFEYIIKYYESQN